jgi:hypothetical protein
MRRLIVGSALTLLTLALAGPRRPRRLQRRRRAACDPDLVGTICTIAGNGENGYDKDADTTVLSGPRGQDVAAPGHADRG